MNHLFVPYELALKLKEKGFDEPCFYHWERGNGDMEEVGKNEKWALFTSTDWLKQSELMNSYFDERGNKCGEFSAPLYQQVIDWLRKKHGIYIELLIDGWGNDESVSNENIGYRAYIWQVSKPKPQPNDDLGMSSYQNILNIAIEKALKLI